MQYRVKWEIDVEADDPVEAALKAWKIVRRRGTTATVMSVFGPDEDNPGDLELIETVDIAEQGAI